MLYNEFLGGVYGTQWQTDLSNYNNFANYLTNRFSYAKLIYDEQKTYNLLKVVLQNHLIKIKQIEVLSNITFDISELGSNTVSNAKTKSDGTSENTLSYTGYNVDSDYNKNSANVKSTLKSDSTVNVLNKFKESAELASSEIARLFDEISKDLWNLFVQLY